jgi:hypothetical protein
MKIKKTILLTITTLWMTLPVAFAQKLKLIQGDLSALKDETELNVAYEYSPMRVGKFEKEEDYIAKKKAEYNEKEAGRGEKWEAAWIGDRSERFEPQFEELFNKHAKNLKVGSNPSAKYTLIIKTTFTEPGFNVYVTRKNASIDGQAIVVKTGDTTPIATISFEKAPGRTFGGYDYDTGTRIQEAYAMLGKSLGKFMSK